MIPLSVPNFEGNEEKYVQDAVSQGWVSTVGAYVEKLESVIAEYANVPAAVACQSGTAALHLSLIGCNIGSGDMVIVPTLTFIAAVNPVKYVQASPVFMDCDDSLCIDPQKIKKFCEEQCEFDGNSLLHKESGKNIKAIIVVHVFGNLADMESIMKISEKYHLKVIEDATEALGSYYEEGIYKGKMAGTIGDFGAYSFNGNKIITTGGGGAIVSNDAVKLSYLKYLSTQAKDDSRFFIHHEVGYNYRMTNVQAAIGVAQMEELEEFIARKNRNYEAYKKLLDNVETGVLLPFKRKIRANMWFYSFLINKDICKKNVQDFVNLLQKRNIQSRPIWGLIHEQKPYQADVSYMIELAKYYSERIINLPCSTSITKKEIIEVVNGLIEITK